MSGPPERSGDAARAVRSVFIFLAIAAAAALAKWAFLAWDVRR